MSTADAPGLIDRLRALDPERHARRLAPAGAALCLLAAALGSWYGLFPAVLGLSLLLVSCLSRDDGLLVLGPFVRYELVRASRRRFPPALFRAAYAAAALVLLGLVYANITSSYGSWRQTHAQQMEQVAVAFFSLFAGFQFLYLAVLTVILIAPVVAEEREAKRLDFLLVSDLRNREILLGKAAGRLPQLLDPALASLPILALLPFFGGVPPGFVIAAALATCATVIGLAGVSFFGSIIAPNPTKASDFAVGLGFAYVALSGLPWLLALLPATWAFPSSLGFRSPVELGDLVRLWSSGNVFAVVVDTGRALSAGADPETTILRAARSYSVFWLGVGALFGLMAVSRLRTAKVLIPADPKLGQPTGAETGPAATPRRPVTRPPVWDDSVLWYEVYRSPSPLVSPDWREEIGRHAILGVVLIVLLHLVSHLIPGPTPEIARGLIALAVWGMSFGMTVGATVRANTTVARERQAGTLDGLMLTGLGCREILRQKWFGSVAGLHGIFGVLLGALAAGLLSLSLHPVSAAVILLATPVHVAFGASLGLVCGVRARTLAAAGRDLVLVVVGALFVGGVVAVSLIPEGAGPLVGPAMVPPAATGLLTMGPVAMQGGPRRGPAEPPVGAMLAGAAVGTVLYAGLAVLLWRAAVRRFEREWEPRQ
jgi:ABC-type transport system involved in multi-copper enzyme maturation permease subunit